MHLNQWMTCVTAGLILAGNSAFAASPTVHEQLQVPQCLAAKLTKSYEILAENKQFKIIDVPSTDVDNLTVLADQVKCGHFVNVSHKLSGVSLLTRQQAAQNILKKSGTKSLKASQLNAEVYEIKHQDEVNAALKEVVADNIWQTLTHLTTYHNRSATKNTGVETAHWLKSTFEAMAIEYGRDDTATFLVDTGWYKQPSLVTVIGKDIKAPAIVIGAHMDTLDGRMPGAGDDGSGSSSIMEAARVLLASQTTFKRPIYIIWYAAEERGLVGSQYVVQHFVEHSIPVKAAIQFDMTGYRVDPKDPTMWVFTDYTHKGLSNYVAKLIDTYIHVPVDYSRCGYGCSDHASWTEEGIPAAFPCESNFEDHNPYIHSSSDTMDLLSLEHMTNFSKLALAFAMELASE
ncbi:aminopeptidase LapA [Legionella maioricensis]|uniref:M20/M25/M40 family metallo-hydrolase n=1 Tax=Legionella maioricensis TaxID=2896528 RepID=A0A9X2D0C6_9GAMM|nr:M20/M25/M40 family metallo-hydrolase [Legionella maioricensis]MCL9683775.1 M20/M25/M40 family metallo-hydrolase [Legionella maioricensis]MCL9686622.1 M20/M25/M40 family metallo-hydrolase [Legionella maioricensis]